MSKITSLFLLGLVIGSEAFAPTCRTTLFTVPDSSTKVNAGRREILELGGFLLAGLKNPAGETFKGAKKTKGTFIPGKGLRQHDDDDFLIAGLKNPAGETFKGGKKTKGTFIPGKGLRQHDDDDFLIAGLKSPAGETFKGAKMTKGTFIPGKGLRQHDDDNDYLIAGLKNPAGETFKGGKMTKGVFIPGKGLRQHDDDFLIAGLKNPAGETFKARPKTKGTFIPGKGIRVKDDDYLAIKRNLPIVSAITALDLPDGQSILLVIHEGIYNETSNHTLLSEFQLREFGVIIDSTCHRHGGPNK